MNDSKPGRRRLPSIFTPPSGFGRSRTQTSQPAASAARAELVELDRKPSSCPYLYAWNGERFEFVALAVGFLVGSVFPVYIPVFPPSWGPELVLSLFTMVSLFVFATFLK